MQHPRVLVRDAAPRRPRHDRKLRALLIEHILKLAQRRHAQLALLGQKAEAREKRALQRARLPCDFLLPVVARLVDLLQPVREGLYRPGRSHVFLRSPHLG